MNFHRRVFTIYGKELVSILRDHRTLIAMIVVPIVLYPILMLGSVQAVSFQADAIREETMRIGVLSEAQAARLTNIINLDAELLAQQRAAVGEDAAPAGALPRPIEKFKIIVFDSVETLNGAVSGRSIEVGIHFSDDRLIGVQHYGDQIQVTLSADREEVRSGTARRRLDELFHRVNTRMRDARLTREGLPGTFFQPFVLDVVDLSAPQSILGQVLPLILILMTITGAIYPAIDLTAGERERGTLESLMCCPTPVIDLIVGKFLVVTTVAILGAALNLASVSATVYFGGFDRIIASTGGGVPIGKMVFILMCLLPFAVLMSAIMIAVCSFARSFKEAQNYVTPVILAVLIPGGIAAMPATRLEGVMMVMPVGNMVLLARDLLLGATVPGVAVATVLLSTTLYAFAAVALAAGIFGRESVVFADSGSLRSVLARRSFRPGERPSPSTGLILVALLFPAWFYVQSAFSPDPGEDASGLLFATGALMPVLFLLVPLAIALYGKMGLATTFRFQPPAGRCVLGAILIGMTAWIPAYELNVVQQSYFGIPETILESLEAIESAMRSLPLPAALVLIALVPALCEEFLFRGFLLSSLVTPRRKWTAIVASAAIFAVFHFVVFRFAVTAGLGLLLGYLVWQSRSIWPAVVVHLLHNGIGVLAVARPEWVARFGLPASLDGGHLPVRTLALGLLIFVAGVVLAGRPGKPSHGEVNRS